MARQILLLLVVAGAAYVAGRISAPASLVTPAPGRDSDYTLSPENAGAERFVASRSAPRVSDNSSNSGTLADDVTALEALAQEIQHTTSPAEKKRDIQSIYRRYALIDPLTALAHAQSLDDSFARRAGVLAVIETLSETDPEFALQAIESVSSTLLHVSLRVVALRGLALRDPVRAAQLTTELPGNTDAYRDTVFRQWATYAPRDAIEFANGQADSETRSLARGVALSNWVATDPDDALAWFQSVRATLNDDELNSLAFTLARTLPERTESIAALLRPEMRRMLMSQRIRMSARDDPQAAVAMLAQTTDRIERGAMLNTIADGFAKRDLTAGLAWAETLASNEKLNALETLYRSWFRSDADAALAHVNSLSEKGRAGMSRIVMSGLAGVDPARAFAWLRNQPNGLDSSGSLMQLAFSWSMRDSDAALSAFAAFQSEPWSRQAITTSLRQLAQHDPVSAQGWVMRLENDSMRRSAAQVVAANMAQNDPDGALGWARSLNADLRDSAVSGAVLTDSVAPRDAFDIALTIDDESLRLKTIEHLFHRTYQGNPELAREWAERAPFDTSKRERLLGMIEGL